MVLFVHLILSLVGHFPFLRVWPFPEAFSVFANSKPMASVDLPPGLTQGGPPEAATLPFFIPFRGSGPPKWLGCVSRLAAVSASAELSPIRLLPETPFPPPITPPSPRWSLCYDLILQGFLLVLFARFGTRGQNDAQRTFTPCRPASRRRVLLPKRNSEEPTLPFTLISFYRKSFGLPLITIFTLG